MMGLLLQRPHSGYDLRKTFGTTAWRHFSDSPGSIYPALKRIEARGWIEPAERPSGARDRRQRQVYRPTSEGESAFVRWLTQPLTGDAVRYRQQELIARFAFMDGRVERAVPMRFLEQMIAEITVYLQELRAQATAMRSMIEDATGRPAIHTGLLAFESGIEGLEAQLAWARRSRARLEETV